MTNKPKTTQPETPNKIQGRDLFQTPNYAVDLLVPFIPERTDVVWECAAGEGKIANRLEYFGYEVFRTDIRDLPDIHISENFLDAEYTFDSYTIITNPPFSLKYKFIQKALDLGYPFAFLIPFDMCKTLSELFSVYKCQGLVPNRRIDYITPTGKSGATGHTSYYHSFWLTKGFDLPEQLTFVELTNKEKKENI